ncbi:inositol 1,4,5-triphosphate receptor associated 2 isoform X2 [Protopterus annectens]|uniref:inositol 1,4,5-triphosphate receptor associated 2 isoform X2 n=1 Tax=Protopterus annectens TaxID=7888 RepID=UPI001CF9F17B|nr:inositol 1,4,5-triphosphate receptor associated 2 isoform X2 [Protopterus annectens]
MMAAESGKRHNPVDSICRKLRTIRMRDQESQSSLQIPKFQSKNFDTPQDNPRKNLELMLKNRTIRSQEKCTRHSGRHENVCGIQSPSYGLDYMKTKRFNSPAVTITEEGIRPLRIHRTQSSSTPVSGKEEACNFTPLRIPKTGEETEGSGHLLHTPASPVNFINLSFNTSLPTCLPTADFSTLRSPVIKRLSLGEPTIKPVLPNMVQDSADVSLICEEDLLDTIFHACDASRRGKVAVSKIVDYLRYTTSRGSEDSGLEELCNMLDPAGKDISIDLDTYHAIMKEWIEDCRKSSDEDDDESTTKRTVTNPVSSVPVVLGNPALAIKKSSILNITTGSLEAFGGEVSKGDLETSDLITCVADLQFNTHKLQEENVKLKLAQEALEESTNKLLEENEELRDQIKCVQHSAMKAKSMKEDLEEMKSTLSGLEEQKAKLEEENKHLGKENQALISKISSLQQENSRNMLDIDDLQKKVLELSNKNTELQEKLQETVSIVASKEATLQEKNLHIEELKSTISEYSSILEILRLEKNKLKLNIQLLQQELATARLDSPVICKPSNSITGGTNSLRSELAFAQQTPESSVSELMSVSSSNISYLDNTLDKEVLMLLQGPGQEQTEAEFKAVLAQLYIKFSEDSEFLDVCLQQLAETNQSNLGKKLELFKKQLKEREEIWSRNLQLLEHHKQSIDREFIRMAGNLRRSKTEHLRMKKELSSRMHELEKQMLLQEETEVRVTDLNKKLQALEQQLQDSKRQVCDQDTALAATLGQAEGLQQKLNKALSETQILQVANKKLTDTCHTLHQKKEEQECTINALREKLFKAYISGLVCQENLSCSKEVHSKDISCIIGQKPISFPLILTKRRFPFWISPLIDALSLESLESPSVLLPWDTETTSSDTSLQNKSCEVICASTQTDADLSVSTMTDTRVIKEAAFEKGSTISKEKSSKNDASIQVHDAAPSVSANLTTSDGTKLTERNLAAEKTLKENEHKVQKDVSSDESSNNDETKSRSAKLTEISFSAGQKEVESEFFRLSLAFKCDTFTLEKRLQLEERARNLAEENLKKEFNNCLQMVQLLLPHLEKDSKAYDTAVDLEKKMKSLENFSNRVASRSEMLGSIHQENRVSKSVEVMIQHVENLKRMYSKEHEELEELKQVLLQNGKSFPLPSEQGDSFSKKLPASQNPSARRVSIAVIPRNPGNVGSNFDLPKIHEVKGSDAADGRPWKTLRTRKTESPIRPTLKRVVSTFAWGENQQQTLKESAKEEEHAAESARKEEGGERKLSLVEQGKELIALHVHTACDRPLTYALDMWNSFSKDKKLWITIAMIVLVASLINFFTALLFKSSVDAASVGTGDSWMAVQKLLWPYTGLRHNGQPPV